MFSDTFQPRYVIFSPIKCKHFTEYTWTSGNLPVTLALVLSVNLFAETLFKFILGNTNTSYVISKYVQEFAK